MLTSITVILWTPIPIPFVRHVGASLACSKSEGPEFIMRPRWLWIFACVFTGRRMLVWIWSKYVEYIYLCSITQSDAQSCYVGLCCGDLEEVEAYDRRAEEINGALFNIQSLDGGAHVAQDLLVSTPLLMGPLSNFVLLQFPRDLHLLLVWNHVFRLWFHFSVCIRTRKPSLAWYLLRPSLHVKFKSHPKSCKKICNILIIIQYCDRVSP